MNKPIVKFIVISSLFLTLLSGCKQGFSEKVMTSRPNAEIPVVRATVITGSINFGKIAYENLPPLEGMHSDLLARSRWQLKYFTIDNIESTELVNRQWIQFQEISWVGYDGCNQIEGGYKLNEDGAFLANMGFTTLILCHRFDPESQEEIEVGDEAFVEALESAVEYKIREDKLWLFYPADKSNTLVFVREETIED